MNNERGQAFPLAMLALAFGTLVISPFLGHVSSSLTGSRIYEQGMTELYSCDSGIEWVLWRLKKNPVLTTTTTYHTSSLEPIPGEINGSSFPATELRFVGNAGATETITPEWPTTPGWHDYPVNTTDMGTITVVIESDAPFVIIRLAESGEQYQFSGGCSPCTAEFEIYSAGSYVIRMQTRALPNNPKIPFEGLGTIAITYPIASYDIRAQKGDRTITARATASYLETRVISWQIE